MIPTDIKEDVRFIDEALVPKVDKEICTVSDRSIVDDQLLKSKLTLKANAAHEDIEMGRLLTQDELLIELGLGRDK